MAIWTGPEGEAGSASRKAMEDYAVKQGLNPGAVSSQVVDGRTHFYIPGVAIDQRNATWMAQNAPGAADTLAGDGGLIDPATGGFVDTTTPGSPYYGGVEPGVTTSPSGEVLTPGGAYSSTPDTGTGMTPEQEAAREAARRSARATIATSLMEIGLEDMTDWAYNLVLQDMSAPEILLALRQTDRYKTRFVANQYRQAKGFNLLSEREILAYETAFRQTLREWGVPLDLYDTIDDIAQFLGKDLSVPEIDRRIERGYNKVVQSPELRGKFRDWYGPDGDTALAMYFFDTDKALPLLEKQAGAATLGGAGVRYGVTLTKQRAEGLMDLGVNVALAPQAFGKLGQIDPLFRESVSESQDLTAEEEGIDYVFGVNNRAEALLNRRLEDRTAAFQGGGQARLGRDSSAFASTK